MYGYLDLSVFVTTNQLEPTAKFSELNQQIQLFLNFMHVERGASVNTVDAYRNDISQLSNFLTSQQEDSSTHWSNVNAKQLSKFMIFLQNFHSLEACI